METASQSRLAYIPAACAGLLAWWAVAEWRWPVLDWGGLGAAFEWPRLPLLAQAPVAVCQWLARSWPG